MSERPITPYPEPSGGFTSGHTGSETSRDRALTEDADGITSRRQQRVMQLLRQYTWKGDHSIGQHYGLTVKEVREITEWHHGQASSALSVLHKEGKIARLTARRDRCAVYVLPEYVQGRETATVGRTAATPARPTLTELEQQVLVNVKRDLANGMSPLRRYSQVLVDAIERLTS